MKAEAGEVDRDRLSGEWEGENKKRRGCERGNSGEGIMLPASPCRSCTCDYLIRLIRKVVH